MDSKPTQTIIHNPFISEIERNENISLSISDMMVDMDNYFLTSECETNFVCVLCGEYRYFHSNKHKFIETKEAYRCKKCNKFFFQHFPHINSCYDPKISVKLND